jgi:phosphoribosylamine-glycine ligase
LKKVLVLGVGNAQVDAIRYCKQEGFEVHGLSYLNDGPGIELLDYFAVINIIDKAGVADYCKNNQIDVIYSVGSDLAMPTVGYVAEQLKIPMLINEKTATILNNKVALRENLNKANISSVKYKEASNVEELKGWRSFPAIIKPVDSQGQRGVYELFGSTDLEKYFEKSIQFSHKGRVIVEEYIQGPEISVNAFVYKGEMKYAFVSDRLVVEDLPGGIVRGHNFPSNMPEKLQRECLALVKDSIQLFNIKNGPVYYQIKYTDTSVKIIEMTARLDGCHMWRLIKMNFDIDLLDLTFKTLLCEDVQFTTPKKSKDLQLVFPLQKFNTTFKKEAFQPLIEKSVFHEFYYLEGDKIRKVNGHIEKTGVIIK